MNPRRRERGTDVRTFCPATRGPVQVVGQTVGNVLAASGAWVDGTQDYPESWIEQAISGNGTHEDDCRLLQDE